MGGCNAIAQDAGTMNDVDSSGETYLMKISRNDDGSTVLHAAIQNKDDAWTQYFLDKKHSVNVVNDEGEVPLHFAAKNKDYTLMQQLLDLGADINAKDINDATTAFISILLEDTEMIKLLIENNADFSIPSKWGTPLDRAEKNKLLEIVELLKNELL
jgi:ankyrin repeat protein